LTGNKQVRILVTDSDRRVRSALQMLLQQEPGLALMESWNLESLVTQAREFKPDMVLLDWELPGRPAAALLVALHGFDYQPKVIVLSQRPESAAAALNAGADAFVSKTAPPQILLDVIRNQVCKVEADE